MPSNVALPVPSPTIPVAGFKDVYDTGAVERALQELPASANEALRALYEKMLRLGGQRFAVKPSGLPQMQTLFEELPNFDEVLEYIRRQLALCVDSEDDIELQPILLLGDPGIGKTHFARRVSQLLGTGYGFVPMSSLTAGWVLSGASSQWKNAKPGKVFETFLNGEYANPVLVVDEIDKASADGQYDPLGALYELLETQTAARFTDEFAEIPIDASGAVWFATANDAARIPEPLLNRMHVYEIEAPDAEGSARIARALYREIRDAHDWGRRFPETPSGSVVEKLALLTPREMRRAVQAAFGNAKVAGRDELAPEDVDLPRGGRKSRIGF
ncbi:MAG TPA: AAA family ATPase [Burkholderiales bacterium]|jgi:ATP-dependent Lon protease|nr:AAA family ATPase [Burkholderiales bacterium]